jgi:hypothetical protein
MLIGAGGRSHRRTGRSGRRPASPPRAAALRSVETGRGRGVGTAPGIGGSGSACGALAVMLLARAKDGGTMPNGEPSGAPAGVAYPTTPVPAGA